MSAGSKILDGLSAAVKGNISRVTIDGKMWVRVSDLIADLEKAKAQARLLAFEECAKIADIYADHKRGIAQRYRSEGENYMDLSYQRYETAGKDIASEIRSKAKEGT